MREIKFRGKRIDNIKHEKKDFVYGSLLYINDYDYDWDGSKSGKKEEVYFIVDETDINIIVSKDTIGQYIGLKDENGKEIYEGDIVKVENIDLAQIIYDEDRMAWGIEPIDEFYFDSPFLADNINMKLEVVGNIYDNPELIK